MVKSQALTGLLVALAVPGRPRAREGFLGEVLGDAAVAAQPIE
jgi:hypothetical protein